MRAAVVMIVLALASFGITLGLEILLESGAGWPARLAIAASAGLAAVPATLVARWTWKKLRARAAVPRLAREVKQRLRRQVRAAARQVSRTAPRGTSGLRVLALGATGAGKSSAFERSRVLSPSPDVPSAPGEPEWWFGEGLSVVEAPARYADEGGENRLEWLELLRQHRARGRCGVACVVAIVELSDLLEKEKLAATAKRLGRQLRDVVVELEIHPAAVLLLTKADVLPGWVEALATLPRADREKRLGCTFELDPERETVEAAIGTLSEHLAGWVERKIASFRGLETPAEEIRRRGFELPVQVRACAARISALIEGVRKSGPGPVWRGIYFTSAGQGAQVTDFALGELRGAFGMRPERAAHTTTDFAASMFLSELFRTHLSRLSTSTTFSDRRRRRRIAFGAALLSSSLCVSALLIAGWSASHTHNRQLLEGARQAVLHVHKNRSAEGDDLDRRIDAIAELESVVRTLQDHDAGGVPLRFDLGLYVGSALLPAARRELDAALRPIFVEPVRAEMEAILGDSAHWTDEASAYTTLDAYLMLADPRLLEPAQATEPFVRLWHRRLPPNAHQAERNRRIVDTFLRFYKSGVVNGVATNSALIERARRSLRERDSEYTVVFSRANGTDGASAVRIEELLPEARGVLEARRTVPAGYTLRAWRALRGHFREGFPEIHARALASAADDKELAEMLRRRYFERYAEAWLSFLESVHPRSAESSADMARLLDKAVKDDLHKKLLIRIDEQMMLCATAAEELAVKELAAKTPAQGPAGIEVQLCDNPARKKLQPILRLIKGASQAQIDGYTGQLAALEKELGKLTPSPASSEALKPQLSTAHDLAARVLESAEPLSYSIDALFQGPVQLSEQVLNLESAQQRRDLLRQNICDPFIRNFAKRYPFDAEGEDVELEQFGAFFGPRGALWTFYAAQLEKYLPAGSDCRFGSAEKDASPLPEWIAPFLSGACRIREAFFRGADGAPNLDLSLQELRCPKDTFAAKEIRLDVDGEIRALSCGLADEIHVTWPGKQGRALLELAGGTKPPIDPTISQARGAWALLRLLRSASSRKDTGGRWDLSWRQKDTGHEVRIKVRAKGDFAIVLDPATMSALSCPLGSS